MGGKTIYHPSMSANLEDVAPRDEEGDTYEAGAFGVKTVVENKPTYRSYNFVSAIMGSGQSINTDAPYELCTSSGEEPSWTKLESGMDRRIGGIMARPQAVGSTENRSAIAQSEEEPTVSHQHASQQTSASSKATRALAIPELCESARTSITANAFSYSCPPHPPVPQTLGGHTSNRSPTKLHSTINQNRPLSTDYELCLRQPVLHTFDVQPSHRSPPLNRLSIGLQASPDNAAVLENGSQKKGSVNIGRGISSRDSELPHAVNSPNVGILRAEPLSRPRCDGELQQQLPLKKLVLEGYLDYYLENPNVSYITRYSHALPTMDEIWMLNDPVSVSEACALVEKVGFANARRLIVEKRMGRQIAEIDKLTDPRKKFRKLRIIFDEKMRESDQWYRREQKCEEQIKRLAQEVDELLDLLLDNNNCAQIPADKRFDLSEGSTLSPLPPLVSDEELKEAAELNTPAGQAMYKEIREMMEEKTAAAAASLSGPRPLKSLSHLVATVPHISMSHTSFIPSAFESIIPPDGHTSPLTYLTPDQIDDYLFDVDASLGNASVPPAPAPQAQLGQENRDLALRNPNSVYNWLRKNEPKVFLQDNEGSEKSLGKPGALRGAGKRASIPAPSKPDALEFVEEDGIGYDGSLTGTGASAIKGKRKRDDDDGGTYHPKSGKLDDTGAKVRVKRKYVRKEPKTDNGEENEEQKGKEKEKDTPAKAQKKKASRKPKEKLSSPPPGAHPFGPM